MSVTESVAVPDGIEHLLANGWTRLETSGFIELVGPLLVREKDGEISYGFVAAPKHENRRGVIHGGMLATFSDRTMGTACRRATGDLPQATIDLSIHYIDAVNVGEFVEIVPEVVRKTRSVVFVRGTLTVGDRVVATADGIWKVLTPKQAR